MESNIIDQKSQILSVFKIKKTNLDIILITIIFQTLFP